MSTQDHWDRVYSRKTDDQLSWHQDDPAPSFDLMDRAGLTSGHSVIDIGGGTSRIVDGLLARGLRDLAVLDLSPAALDAARTRLGPAGATVTWIAADVTRWRPSRNYDLWHDRAVLHFLIDPTDRAAYVDRLNHCLRPGGHAIIATFAPDGPESCSGLPVHRDSPETLAELLGAGFTLVAHLGYRHLTPWKAPQSFQYSLFRKLGGPV